MQNFERFPDLALWIERLANVGMPGWSMMDWQQFTDALNASLSAPAQCALDEALKHLGNAVFFASDVHPDDRNEALDKALAFYNKSVPKFQVGPSGLGYQRLVDAALTSTERGGSK